MLLLSLVTGVVGWFILMTFLRRLMLLSERVKEAKVWLCLSLLLIACLFALATVFSLSIVEQRFLDAQFFLMSHFLFFIALAFTSYSCVRKALK